MATELLTVPQPHSTSIPRGKAKLMSDRMPDTNEWKWAESHFAPCRGEDLGFLFCLFLGGGVHREQCGECSGNSDETAPKA